MEETFNFSFDVLDDYKEFTLAFGFQGELSPRSVALYKDFLENRTEFYIKNFNALTVLIDKVSKSDESKKRFEKFLPR